MRMWRDWCGPKLHQMDPDSRLRTHVSELRRHAYTMPAVASHLRALPLKLFCQSSWLIHSLYYDFFRRGLHFLRSVREPLHIACLNKLESNIRSDTCVLVATSAGSNLNSQSIVQLPRKKNEGFGALLDALNGRNSSTVWGYKMVSPDDSGLCAGQDCPSRCCFWITWW